MNATQRMVSLCLSLHISSVGNATSAPTTVIVSRFDVRGMRIGARWGRVDQGWWH
jgi:hypothetical protein